MSEIGITITMLLFLIWSLPSLGKKCHLQEQDFPPHPLQDNSSTDTMNTEPVGKRSVCNWTLTWSKHEADRLPHRVPVASCEVPQRGHSGDADTKSLRRCVQVHYQIPVWKRTVTNHTWNWEPAWERVPVSCAFAMPRLLPARRTKIGIELPTVE